MRILIYTQYFPPEIGAAQTRLASMALALKDMGHEVEVLTALPNYPFESIFEDYKGQWSMSEDWNGITVHRCWLYSAQGSGFRRLLNYLSFVVASFFTFSRCSKPDVIFVNSGPLFLSIPAYFAARNWGVTYIFNVSDLWPRSVEKLGVLTSRWLLGLAEKLESWSYKNAVAVTAVTDGIRKILIEEKEVPAEKIGFLPNGLDLNIFSCQGPVADLGDFGLRGKKVFVYPGTHGYAHALEKVLEAAKLIQDPDVHILFVGGGSEKPNLVAKAQRESISNVTFADPVPQDRLHAILRASFCGLIHQRDTPLANETRPAKMFPILGSSRGVIFGGFGEGAKFIKEINAGIVVEPENPAQMASAIQEVAVDPERVAQWGKSGREFVEKNMGWQTLVQNWFAGLFPISAKSERPLVSIIMPAYNAKEFLAESIESVLGQSYDNWELLIGDDCSSDETCEIADSYAAKDKRIRVIRGEHQGGPALARNRCMEKASGDFLAFLDSDDLWLPHKLERQLNFMMRMKCPISYTSFRRISQNGSRLGRILPIPARVTYEQLLKHNVIGTLTVMVDFRRVGAIRMKPVGYEDFVLWLEIVQKHGYALGLNEDCARYRVVSGSMSANKIKAAFRVWTNYRKIQNLSFVASLYYFLNYAIRVSYKHSRF